MSLPLTAAFELYRRDFIVFRNQSKRTEEMHNLVLKLLLNFMGNIPIEDLTFQDVRDWKEWLEKDKSQNTVRGYVIRLRVVLGFLKARGFEVIDPDAIGVPQRNNVPVDYVSPDEVYLLIRASFMTGPGISNRSRYRNRALISLLYASGIRVSELCALNRSDLKEDRSFVVIGKGNKARVCFFDRRTQRYLDEYIEKYRIDNNPALFLSNETGQRISKGTVQHIFRVARRKAGFKATVHPHTMRHSFATNLLNNDANIMHVKEFLGHESVQTTQMYLHVVNSDLRKIYEAKHTT